MSPGPKKQITHLREVTRLPVKGDQFVLRGNRLIAGTHYGKEPYELTVVDISKPAAPRVLSQMPFRRQMQSMADVDDVLYVFEYARAIHLVRLDETSRPETFDCHLMFREDVYEFQRVGKKWLVAARNWEGVSVFDVSDPRAPRQTDQKKLGESFVESIAVAGERVFAAGHDDGLVELAIDANGKIVEVARHYGEGNFSVQHVFVAGDRLWVFGSGEILEDALTEDTNDQNEDEEEEEDGEEEESNTEDAVGAEEDEEYEEEPQEPDTLILSLDDLSRPLWRGHSDHEPNQLRGLPDGGAIAIDSYSCHLYPPTGKQKVLFQLYETEPKEGSNEPKAYFERGPKTPQPEFEVGIMDDASCWARRGDYLLLKTPNELVVFWISPASPLAQMAEG